MDTESRGIMAVTAMEIVYQEQAQGMSNYLKELKGLPHEEAKKIAKRNLMEAGIINGDGSLSDRYQYSKQNARRK